MPTTTPPEEKSLELFVIPPLRWKPYVICQGEPHNMVKLRADPTAYHRYTLETILEGANKGLINIEFHMQVGSPVRLDLAEQLAVAKQVAAAHWQDFLLRCGYIERPLIVVGRKPVWKPKVGDKVHDCAFGRDGIVKEVSNGLLVLEPRHGNSRVTFVSNTDSCEPGWP